MQKEFSNRFSKIKYPVIEMVKRWVGATKGTPIVCFQDRKLLFCRSIVLGFDI